MSKFLVFTVVIAAVALIAATDAGAFNCEGLPLVPVEGVYTCPDDLEGTCCATIEVPGSEEKIVVEVIPDFGNYTNGTNGSYDGSFNFPDNSPTVYTEDKGETGPPLCADNKGNEIPCDGNAYLIHKPSEVVITHVGLSYPADVDLEQIYPADRSTTTGPSCKGWLDDVGSLNAVCSKAIKAISYDKDVVSVGFAKNGAERGSILLIASELGYLYGSILTPSGCVATNIDTQNLITIPGVDECEQTDPGPPPVYTKIEPVDVEVNYDQCSGVAEPPIASFPGGGSLEVDEVVAARCDDDAGSPDLRSCHTIKRLGARSGTAFNACSDGFNYIYFGYADRIYRIETGNPCNDSCTGWDPTQQFITRTGPCIKEKVFDDGQVKFVFDDTCTTLENICFKDDCAPPSLLSSQTDPGANELAIWVCSSSDLDAKRFSPDVCGYITDFDMDYAGVASNGWWGGYGGMAR